MDVVELNKLVGHLVVRFNLKDQVVLDVGFAKVHLGGQYAELMIFKATFVKLEQSKAFDSNLGGCIVCMHGWARGRYSIVQYSSDILCLYASMAANTKDGEGNVLVDIFQNIGQQLVFCEFYEV